MAKVVLCMCVCESTFVRNFTVNQTPAENATEIKQFAFWGSIFWKNCWYSYATSGRVFECKVSCFLFLPMHFSPAHLLSDGPPSTFPPYPPPFPNIFRSCILRPHFCQVLSQREVIPIPSSCIMMWLTIQVIASFTTLIVSRTEMKH